MHSWKMARSSKAGTAQLPASDNLDSTASLAAQTPAGSKRSRTDAEHSPESTATTPLSSTKKSAHAPPPESTVSSSGAKKECNEKDTDSSCLKANRGLRHFSMEVCKKVEEKGHTSYNEVADELVKEFIAAREDGDDDSNKERKKTYDEKNIRRRVYDALNVLMAMDIISKEKKEIKWKGLPTNEHHDLDMFVRERDHRRKEVERKRECLQELLVQNVCFRNLVRRNRERDESLNIGVAGPLPQCSDAAAGEKKTSEEEEEKIPLPFIVVNTSSQAVIQCEMCPDRTDVMFDFSMPFEINDDNEILKQLGLNKTTHDDLRRMLPRDLLIYCQEHRLLDSMILPPNIIPGRAPPAQQQQHLQSGAKMPPPHNSLVHHTGPPPPLGEYHPQSYHPGGGRIYLPPSPLHSMYHHQGGHYPSVPHRINGEGPPPYMPHGGPLPYASNSSNSAAAGDIADGMLWKLQTHHYVTNGPKQIWGVGP